MFSKYNETFGYNENAFRRIQEISRAEAGIDFSISKYSLVFSRVARRIRYTNRKNFSAYLDYVCSAEGASERTELICVLTTNMTLFFREKTHFIHLEQHVLPHLSRKIRAGGRGRMWSAACSTGQEAWSMGMSLLSVVPEAARLDMRILGTDINHLVIDVARQGCYSQEEADNIPSKWRRKYMASTKSGDYQVLDSLRKICTFNRLNLNREWPFYGKFDVIFCRNVVIYFDEKTKNALWERLAKRILPGGFLYVGHSERVDNASSLGLEAIAPTIYKKVSL